MLYHCLLVGLQELELSTTPKLSEEALVEEIREALTDQDRALFDLVAMQPQDQTISDLLEQHEELREESPLSDEDLRWQLVYELGAKSKNPFVRDWFAFNLTVNNVLAAAICRKHHFDVKKAIVGEGEVQDMLRTSQQKDFGLSATVDGIQDILRLAEIDDLYEREKKTDALRWEWLEQKTLFNYYELENVLCYYLRSKMLYRWGMLTVEEGTRVFRELIADMKRDVKF